MADETNVDCCKSQTRYMSVIRTDEHIDVTRVNSYIDERLFMFVQIMKRPNTRIPSEDFECRKCFLESISSNQKKLKRGRG